MCMVGERMKLMDHALSVVEELGRRRDADGVICSLSSVEMLDALDLGRQSGKLLGSIVSLLDVACLSQDLPWIGRLIAFRGSADDFSGPWESWAPFAVHIKRAPALRRWSDDDFVRVRAGLFEGSPEPWWRAQLVHSESWLRRASLVALNAYADRFAAGDSLGTSRRADQVER